MHIHDFCQAVGDYVKHHYGHEDGAGLAFNMIERGDATVDDNVAVVAREVAQLLEQA